MSRAGRRWASPWWHGGVTTGWLSALAAALLAAAVLAFSLWMAGRFPGLLLFVPPVVINLALCALFARTLAAGAARRWSASSPASSAAVSCRPISRVIPVVSPGRGRSSSWRWRPFPIDAGCDRTLDAWSLFTNVAELSAGGAVLRRGIRLPAAALSPSSARVAVADDAPAAELQDGPAPARTGCRMSAYPARCTDSSADSVIGWHRGAAA